MTEVTLHNDTKINNIPAASLEEACQKIATKKNMRFVKTNSGEFYAIDQAEFTEYYQKSHDPEFLLKEFAKQLEQGDLDDFYGLYKFSEYDGVEENWKE